MSDGIEFRFDILQFDRFIIRTVAEMPPASRRALDEAGRAAQAAAKAHTPVLSGRLRDSITPTPGGPTPGQESMLGVGPRGAPMFLYSKKEEARAGYMQAGADAAETVLAVAAEREYGTVWRG